MEQWQWIPLIVEDMFKKYRNFGRCGGTWYCHGDFLFLAYRKIRTNINTNVIREKNISCGGNVFVVKFLKFKLLTARCVQF